MLHSERKQASIILSCSKAVTDCKYGISLNLLWIVVRTANITCPPKTVVFQAAASSSMVMQPNWNVATLLRMFRALRNWRNDSVTYIADSDKNLIVFFPVVEAIHEWHICNSKNQTGNSQESCLEIEKRRLPLEESIAHITWSCATALANDHGCWIFCM